MTRAFGAALVAIGSALILFTLLFTSAMNDRCNTPAGLEARATQPAFAEQCSNAGILSGALGVVDLVLIVAGALHIVRRRVPYQRAADDEPRSAPPEPEPPAPVAPEPAPPPRPPRRWRNPASTALWWSIVTGSITFLIGFGLAAVTAATGGFAAGFFGLAVLMTFIPLSVLVGVGTIIVGYLYVSAENTRLPPPSPVPACAHCGATLTGAFCAACGAPRPA